MTEPSRQARQHMRDLPEPALPDTVWQRVEAGRRLRMQQRKFGLVGVAMALLAALSTPVFMGMLGGGDPLPVAHRVVHEPSRSEQDLEAELRALDHALQVAYERGASDAEVAPMWVARNALLSHPHSRQTRAKNDQT